MTRSAFAGFIESLDFNPEGSRIVTIDNEGRTVVMDVDSENVLYNAKMEKQTQNCCNLLIKPCL